MLLCGCPIHVSPGGADVGDAVGPGPPIAYVHEQHGQGETRRPVVPRSGGSRCRRTGSGDLAQAPPPTAFVGCTESRATVSLMTARKVGLGEVLVNRLLHLAPEVLRGLDLDGRRPRGRSMADSITEAGVWRDHERSQQPSLATRTPAVRRIFGCRKALEAEALQPRGLVDGRQPRRRRTAVSRPERKASPGSGLASASRTRDASSGVATGIRAQ